MTCFRSIAFASAVLVGMTVLLMGCANSPPNESSATYDLSEKIVRRELLAFCQDRQNELSPASEEFEVSPAVLERSRKETIRLPGITTWTNPYDGRYVGFWIFGHYAREQLEFEAWLIPQDDGRRCRVLYSSKTKEQDMPPNGDWRESNFSSYAGTKRADELRRRIDERLETVRLQQDSQEKQ